MNSNPTIEFIGIGAPKSGTSFLTHALRAHPQICLALLKETNFFMGKNPLAHDKLFKYDGSNISDYAFYYKECGSKNVKGEFSVHYMHDPDSARKIHENYPDTKILAILRNPVSRFISDFRFRKYMRKEISDDLGDILFPENLLIRYGMYHEQLSRYFALFPRENIKVVIFEEMTKNPQKIFQEVYSFLEVDDSFIPTKLLEKKSGGTWNNPRGPHNVTRGQVRSMLVMKIAHKIRLSLIRIGLHSPVERYYGRARHFVEKYNLKKVEYENIDDSLKRKIGELYSEDTKKLETLIQKDLSALW